jgi:hypothetical protein
MDALLGYGAGSDSGEEQKSGELEGVLGVRHSVAEPVARALRAASLRTTVRFAVASRVPRRRGLFGRVVQRPQVRRGLRFVLLAAAAKACWRRRARRRIRGGVSSRGASPHHRPLTHPRTRAAASTARSCGPRRRRRGCGITATTAAPPAAPARPRARPAPRPARRRPAAPPRGARAARRRAAARPCRRCWPCSMRRGAAAARGFCL